MRLNYLAELLLESVQSDLYLFIFWKQFTLFNNDVLNWLKLDIYNVTKYFKFKTNAVLLKFLFKSSWKLSFPQKYDFNIINKKKCFLSSKSAY